MILQLVLSRIIPTPAASSWHPDNGISSNLCRAYKLKIASMISYHGWYIELTGWWCHGFLSPSTAALCPAPQPPTSLLSPSSAWSSAGRLPIIPSYTLQPLLKIFSVLTKSMSSDKNISVIKYYSPHLFCPKCVAESHLCLLCVEDVGAGDHVSSVRPRGWGDN